MIRRVASSLTCALVLACSQPTPDYSNLRATFEDSADVFVKVCLAPRISPDRIEALARDGRWRRVDWYEQDDRRYDPVNFLRTWEFALNDATVRVTLGGYYLDKWFAWPLDNDIPGYVCKLEFSGGDPLEIVDRVRAEGFRDIQATPREGTLSGQYDAESNEYSNRSFQLGGRGCVVNYSYNFEGLDAEGGYSRTISASCSR